MAAALKIVTVGNLNVLPFWSVPLGASSTLALVIKNTGNTNLTISAITLTITTGNASDFILNGFTGTLTIAPGAVDISLSITFTPSSTAETLEEAILQFTSNSVSGPSTFQVNGTSANPGAITTAPGSSNESAIANQAGNGNTTVTSAACTFAAGVIPVGARVTISLNFKVVPTVSGGGAGVGKAQVSYDSGTTWSDLYGSTAATDIPLTLTLINGLTNFNTIRIRASSFAVVTVAGNSNYETDLSNISITSNVGGDDSVQPVLVYAGFVDTFAIFDFGAVAVGGAYNSDSIKVNNFTAGPLTVILAFDTTEGFSLQGAIVGANPIPAGASVTFQIHLVPPKGGNQDDTQAVTITSGAAGFIAYIEALYQAPMIIPAFILAGDQEQTVLALKVAASAHSALYNFDQTLAPESATAFSRQLYLDQPQLNKAVNRVFLLFEQMGAATVTLSLSTLNPTGITLVSSTLNLPAASDGKLNIGVWDLQVTGSVINFAFSTTGRVSIVGFVIKADEIGEVIENT